MQHPYSFRSTEPLLSNHATPLVSMQLGYRAELPQTRYPLICARAFSLRLHTRALLLPSLLSRWSQGSRLPALIRQSRPCALATEVANTFRKGMITFLADLQSLPPRPCSRVIMDTVHHGAWLSLLGWSISLKNHVSKFP